MPFPSSIDSFTGYTGGETLLAANNAAQENQMQAAIVATETKVGTGASTPTSGTALVGNGTGTSTWRALTSADVGLGNVTNVSQTSILQAVYPIGCIYTETTGVNPQFALGFGTWTRTGQGRVLVGQGFSDQNFAAGSSGGESNHTLSITETPSHTHTATVTDPGHTHATPGTSNGSTGANFTAFVVNANTPQNVSTSTTGITVANSSVGSGASHNNLQPYLVVYFWQRTA